METATNQLSTNPNTKKNFPYCGETINQNQIMPDNPNLRDAARREPANPESIPPHNAQAERLLLACAIHLPELIPTMDESLFYQTESRAVFRKLVEFKGANRPALSDPHTLEHDLMLALDRDTFRFINETLNELPSEHNWPYWLEIVKDFQRARALEQIKPDMTRAAARLVSGDNDGLIQVQKKFTAIFENAPQVGIPTMKEVVGEVIADLDEAWTSGRKLKGIAGGINKLDDQTQGFQKKNFYVIAARPSQGKSTLLLQFAYEAAHAGNKTLFFSLEMQRKDLVGRMASNLSRVPLSKFKQQEASDQDFKNFTAASSNLSKLPLLIIDDTANLSDILTLCHETQGIGLLVVDYLQRVRIPNFRNNRNELVTEISVALKDLSMVLDIPVIAAAQLNRASEKEGRPPTLADLRDSGSIEQDADFVLLLHPQKDSQQTDAIIAKNRSGETGRIPLRFHRNIFRFESVL
jgi:replicative DNA helicase